jgi:hypothetical protein
MPYEWIGQGFGYKTDKNWDDIPDDEIIYIPEYAYENINNADEDDVYTKADFRRLAREYEWEHEHTDEEIERIAEELFESCDWQHPESLIDEGWFSGYEEEE